MSGPGKRSWDADEADWGKHSWGEDDGFPSDGPQLMGKVALVAGKHAIMGALSLSGILPDGALEIAEFAGDLAKLKG